MKNEVRDDSQARMQDLAYKVQLILEWCDNVVVSLQLSPPLLPKGLHPDVPIHVLGRLEEAMGEALWEEGLNRVGDV